MGTPSDPPPTVYIPGISPPPTVTIPGFGPPPAINVPGLGLPPAVYIPGISPPQGAPQPPAAPLPPKQWGGGTVPASGNPASPQLTSQQSANIKNPPPVPGKAGAEGSTTVSTPSLDLFAENIKKLIPAVQLAYTEMSSLPPPKPGSFYDGRVLANSLYDNENAQVTAFKGVLYNLIQGLSSLTLTVQTMSQKYKTIDDLNGANAADLQNDLADTQTVFSNMMSANGGGGGGAGAGGGGGAGSGAGGAAGGGAGH